MHRSVCVSNFLFEPANRRRSAAVLGLRLDGGRYEEVAPDELPNGRRGVRSEVIGLVPYVNEEGDLRWFDPAVGDDLPTYNESEQRRQTAEARVAELEALLRGREG